jgi:hypothetical protein
VQSLFVLHACGARDEFTNSNGQYAIHLAAAAGFRDGLLYMLKNMGAQVDAIGPGGCTPLLLAIQNDHLDVASALLARGADASKMTTEGMLVLKFICGCSAGFSMLLLYPVGSIHCALPDVMLAMQVPLVGRGCAVFIYVSQQRCCGCC